MTRKIDKCEICNKPFTINKKGYIVRRYIGDKVICANCVRSYKKELEFHEKYKINVDYKKMCDICNENNISLKYGEKFICDKCIRKIRNEKRKEERRINHNKLMREISAYKRERTEYLKSISPDELISIVKGNKNEM